VRVRVDPSLCCGHALCIDIAPDVFEFIDLEDRSTAPNEVVAFGRQQAVLRAARECPERAIVVDAEEIMEDESI
jgi:ferredoxin